ncbi:MAG: 4Fe-4S ferredoxin [Anaerolineae bacterium]|nr:4Fe-4S ferredoxin [Anaerolineae bacterium]
MVCREEIHWYPTVVDERCIGCGRNVYQFDYENNVAVVTNPLQCMVGCSTCATVCPREAIEFPSRGYIQQLIWDRKILRQSKDLLRDYPEQYETQKIKS